MSDEFFLKIKQAEKAGLLSPEVAEKVYFFAKQFESSLAQAGKTVTLEMIENIFEFVKAVQHFQKHPFNFEPFHQRVVSPVNYYKLMIDMFSPVVDLDNSTLGEEKNILAIEEQLAKGENVILLANHQSELDPQLIGMLLQEKHHALGENMIYVAGERVITDPLAIPGSVGCNLICIYSKRHIDNPPERRQEKTAHNTATMNKTVELLKEGGKCIYVAPSGGRDRPNTDGAFEVAPFDPQSVEMFYLLAKKAKTPTHFYPLTLKTYPILPPPQTVEKELGEVRTTSYSPIHVHFGNEVDLSQIPADLSKEEKRAHRAKTVQALVEKTYQTL